MQNFNAEQMTVKECHQIKTLKITDVDISLQTCICTRAPTSVRAHTHTHSQKNSFNIPVQQPWSYMLSSVSHMSRTNVEPITG